MEQQKIINDLKEWQGKDEENRAFFLIISEQGDEEKINSQCAAYGRKRMISALLAATMMEQTELFKEATRMLLDSSLEKEEKETDKDTNAVIN